MSRNLIGAMCPTCRTVRDWSGGHIWGATVFCDGTRHTGPHPRSVVIPVCAWRSRAGIVQPERSR